MAQVHVGAGGKSRCDHLLCTHQAGVRPGQLPYMGEGG